MKLKRIKKDSNKHYLTEKQKDVLYKAVISKNDYYFKNKDRLPVCRLTIRDYSEICSLLSDLENILWKSDYKALNKFIKKRYGSWGWEMLGYKIYERLYKFGIKNKLI